MRSGDAALRLSIVFSVAGFFALAAGLYEIDRREKSSSGTVAANLAEMEQRIQLLGNEVRILNDQYATRAAAAERRLQALGNEVQALGRQYDARLNELENSLRMRR